LLIKRYEKEIRELKQELSMHDVLATGGVDQDSGEAYNAETSYGI